MVVPDVKLTMGAKRGRPRSTPGSRSETCASSLANPTRCHSP